MSDTTRITNPIEIKDNSKERVAFDLMEKISNAEKIHNKDGEKKANPREYYLNLYNQCHKVVSWSGIEVKDIL